MWKTVSYWAIVALSVIGGLHPAEAQVKILTVCEVLSDVDHDADTAVAIVGRVERSVSLIDHYEFLSQDHCEHPVIIHGHTWSNRIQILGWEEGMPRPPVNNPRLAQPVIAAKLAAVRETTELGSHQVPGFTKDGHVTYVTVPNEWAVVYGRIVKSPSLDDDCGAGGCGGDDVPLIVIAIQARGLKDDGTPLPANDF